MAQIGFQLASSSRDPGWAPASGAPHDALWQNAATGFTVRPEGSLATPANSNGTNTTGVFDSQDGSIDITSVRFANGGRVDGNNASGGSAVSLDWSAGGTVATLTLDRAWNTIKNAEVDHFTGTSLTLENWVDVWVHLNNSFDQTIVVDGAKRGEVSTGSGNDNIWVGVDSNGSGWTNHFRIDSGAGNDSITVTVATADYSASSFAARYNAAWTTTEIVSGEGNDVVNGAAGRDAAWLGTGNDSFTGHKGDDSADGGQGWDTAFFSGNQANYAITTLAGMTVVRDLRANGSGEGTDTLVNFEALSFADGMVYLVEPNLAPTATTDQYGATAGTLFSVDAIDGALGNDTDPEGAPLTAQLMAGPAHGVLDFNADGSFTYLADAGFEGVDSFAYVAIDSEGVASEAMVYLQVRLPEAPPPPPPPPPPPLASTADSYSMNEDATLNVSAANGVLANDEAAAGTTVALGIGPEFGTLVLDADGSFVFSPPDNWFGTTSFTYFAEAGGRTSAATEVVLRVNAVNDRPVAKADAYALDEGTTLSVDAQLGILANDTDADGDALTMTLANPPTHGTLMLQSDGSFTYTPNPEFAGTDVFTYSLTDGIATVTGTVRFTVNNVDSPVHAVNDTYVGLEDRVLTIEASRGLLVNDSAPDGGLRAIATTVQTQFGGTAVVAADGSFVYTPAADFFGTDSFTYTIRDSDNDRTQGRVFITIADQPEEPYGIRLGDVVANGQGVKFVGAAASDTAGAALAGGLDVNGDGIADLAIGAIGMDGTGRANAGGVHVVFGSEALSGSPSLGSVGTEGGPAGFRILGAVAGDQAGFSVDMVADMNGDGLAEIVIGAPKYDANGTINAGGVFVVWGKADMTTVDLAQVAGGTGGFAILGAATEDNAGYNVSAAGDVNGDGRADLVLGARLADAPGLDQGAAYVVFGKSSGAAVQLSNLGGGGFRITGEATDDEAGWSVAGVGDVNGDGRDDIAIGSRFNDAGALNAGSVHVVFGRSATTEVNLGALGAGGFQILGETANASTGYSIAAAGDVNGDGLDDILLGARGANGGGSNSGGGYVVFGRAATTDLALATLGAGGVEIMGELAGDFAGTSVSGGGDFNSDGFLDYIIGATGNDSGGTNAGAAYIVFGTGAAGVFNLDDAANANGGVRIRGAVANDATGTAVKAVGDINGDGFEDLLVGVPNADSPGSNSGAVYLVFGQAEWLVL
jgi:VCBS repeat-containing protein